MTPRDVIIDIPTEAKADEIVKDFEDDGCTAVKSRQENGQYTVTVDCPESTASSSRPSESETEDN